MVPTQPQELIDYDMDSKMAPFEFAPAACEHDNDTDDDSLY